MFALRARLRLVDAHTRSLLDRAGLTAAEVEQPRDRALQRITTSPHPPVHALRDRLLGQLQRGLSELEEIAKVLDENLLRPIQRTRDSVEHGVDRLLERYGKARAEKDQVSSDRITRLQATLFPNDVPQERFFGLPYFAAKHGLAFLKTRILESIAPYATDIVDVSL